MSFLFFFKPLADLLYKLHFLDIILVYIVLYFIVKGRKVKLITIDYLMLGMGVLFFFSFLRDTSGFSSFIKIESSFLVYFLGRQYNDNWEKYIYALQKGFIIILVVSLFSFVTGTGFQMWGTHNTFCSYYYFKTDAAAALAQCMILFGFVSFEKRIYKYLILSSCLLLIILTNARIYYLVVAVIGLIMILYNKDHINGTEIKFKINLKFILACALLTVLIIVVMAVIVSQYDSSLLLIDMSDKEGLFSEKNTQGRSIVWAKILSYFSQQGLSTQLFGVDLVKDGVIGVICESHNNYIKILFTTGYIGLFLFFSSLYLIISSFNKLTKKRLYYTTLSFLMMYLVSGVSFSSIMFTQLSWIPMFFSGVVISEIQLKNKIERL